WPFWFLLAQCSAETNHTSNSQVDLVGAVTSVLGDVGTVHSLLHNSVGDVALHPGVTIVGDIALDDCAIKDCASLRHTLTAVRGELSDHSPIRLSPLFDFVHPAPRVTDQLHNRVLLEGVPKSLLHLVAGLPV